MDKQEIERNLRKFTENLIQKKKDNTNLLKSIEERNKKKIELKENKFKKKNEWAMDLPQIGVDYGILVGRNEANTQRKRLVIRRAKHAYRKPLT